jgi:hypothetical protein
MKILVTAKYVSGAAFEGGSSRFMKCVIDTLRELGHEVMASAFPNEHRAEKFDLILCSHREQYEAIRYNPARKVCISHGLIDDELFTAGADAYISVSPEVQEHHLRKGIRSRVVGQPIRILPRQAPGKELRNILIIRRETPKEDPFAFLSAKYNVRVSDLSRPIEEQIDWADLCITLGRGALEAMAQGKLVLVADSRHYIGPCGDGYVSPFRIREMARNNFSGRRYRHPLTREWIETELARYNADDSEYLWEWVRDNHEAVKIVRLLIGEPAGLRISFGALVNDPMRLDMVLRQSEFPKDQFCHTVLNPETACKGLNKLLGIMEDEGADVAVLAHQDMFFRSGWIDRLREQIAKLPASWVVAGIIGKDMEGEICGRVHDMRIPLHFSTSHEFPQPASCFDECCIVVNLKKKFRFLEEMPGFDLYGTLCVLQAEETGGTAWMLDCFAEHYCMRPFSWYPDKAFEACFKWLHTRFPQARRIDSTVMGVERKKKIAAEA